VNQNKQFALVTEIYKITRLIFLIPKEKKAKGWGTYTMPQFGEYLDAMFMRRVFRRLFHQGTQ